MQPNKKIDEATRAIQNELFDWWDFDSSRNGRSNADVTISRVKPATHAKKEDLGKYRYSITDVSGVNVSPYAYEIEFMPQTLVPVKITANELKEDLE